MSMRGTRQTLNRHGMEDLRRVLNEVEDPELGIGVVDLGLIYRAEWTESGIEVDFTTTVPSCPYAEFLRKEIDTILRSRFAEASSIVVRLVFDPPWDLHRLSAGAHQALGRAPSTPAGTKHTAETFKLRCWNTGGRTKH